jgi:hypothetical protein
MPEAATNKTVELGVFHRTFEINRAELKDDSRTVELSFSSEAPVEQFGWELGRYIEILDHNPASVDLTRLNNAAPLLMDHNRSDQVGVIESATIGEDRKGRASVRFGKSERAEEIFQDVKDGIRRLVSVGYRVYKLVTEKVENEVETLRATRWAPMEISIVSIPADTSVGIGRSEPPKDKRNQATLENMKPTPILREALPNDGGTPTPPAAPTAPAVGTRSGQIDQKELFATAKRNNCLDLYEQAVEKGWDINKLREEILNAKNSSALPGVSVDPNPPASRTREGQRFPQTPGERLVASDMYRALAKSTAKTKVGAIEIPDAMGFRDLIGDGQTRATLLTTGLTSYERPPGITLVNQQPLTIAQLFAAGETSASTIRIFKETSFTNAATAVAEEGVKPEATFALEEVDFAVKKIAVLGRISDEMLSDYPAVRDYVNSRLAFMVQAKEDNELLNGAGGSSVTGVLQTGSIQTQAYAGNTIFDAIDKGLQKVRTIGFFEPDAIVMHPTDWGNARRSKDSNGQYYAGGPFSGPYGIGGYSVAGFLWGKPVIETTAIAQGTALCGAFRTGGQIFRRMGLTLEMTNSDASDFQYNRIAVRAEERLALVIYRPTAFCTVTGIPSV